MDSTIIVAIIGLASALSVSVIGLVSNRKGKRSKEDQAISDGLQCLLRAEKIRSYEKYSEISQSNASQILSRCSRLTLSVMS